MGTVVVIEDSVVRTSYSYEGVNPRSSVDGEQRNMKLGWKDLKGDFSIAPSGALAPTLVTLPNGDRVQRFGVNDSVFAKYHVNHDYKEATVAYPHVHFHSDTSILAGQTVTWDFIYVSAKGHQQNESLTGARTTMTLTFTAPRNMDAGEHIVLEGTDPVLQTLDLKEPDTLICAEWKYTGGTFTGNMHGLKGDIHFESDHESTNNKAPDFDGAVV